MIIPIIISGVIWGIGQSKSWKNLPGLLFLGWLPSYFWIHGWPNLIPIEANDWLWLVVVASTFIYFIKNDSPRWQIALQSSLFAGMVVIISRPQLQFNFSTLLVFELLIIIAASILTHIILLTRTIDKPALIMAISATGLAVTSGLGGSLVLGQLAGALAAILACFALAELFLENQRLALKENQLLSFTILYMLIIWIGFLFAEIPWGPLLLNLLSPVAGFMINNRHRYLASVVCSIFSISWLLLAAEPSSYY